jgi:anhydro-N-acetylmuramic acid kinase
VKLIKNKQYTVLGIMSGTSLDGLDLAICMFSNSRNKWNYELLKSKTVSYTDELRKQLDHAPFLTGAELINLDTKFGIFIASQSKEFIAESGLHVELICSHGHTVYHQPENGMTCQIGNGASIAAITVINTVSDFRRTDVALGGQGAPLVPAGDELLFSVYDYCLNLGGFANISYRSGNKRIAFDICPVNIILNLLARHKGNLYDEDGLEGASGNKDVNLLRKLNEIEYYRISPPKSLGREWVLREFMPVLESSDLPHTAKMRTVYEHIAIQIAAIPVQNKTMLITGGGAHNKFLLNLIKQYSGSNCVLPDNNLIDYKEAIIFAFLGLLRILEEINCFASVTGATRDSCCGVVNMGMNEGARGRGSEGATEGRRDGGKERGSEGEKEGREEEMTKI